MTCDGFSVQCTSLSEDFSGFDSAPQVVHPLPERLDPGLAVALAPDEAPEHGDQAHDFLELGSGPYHYTQVCKSLILLECGF